MSSRDRRGGRWPVALSIAGSDSIAGAGIQADIKSFSACGVYGVTVVTALTAQNSRGVSAIHLPPSSFVEEEIDQVFSDIAVDSVKTGMLFSSAIIRVVERKVIEYGVKRLVVDPVMIATGGDRLLRRGAERLLITRLLPLAMVVTPNILEAEVISEMRISSVKGMREAAVRIGRLGPKAVVVKGGHLKGEPIDVLWDGSGTIELAGRRLGSLPVHGTGCTFSAALTAFLARGHEITDACRRAKRFTEGTISRGMRLGGGNLLLAHRRLRQAGE